MTRNRYTAARAGVLSAAFALSIGALTGCSALGGLLGGETVTRDAESQEVTEAGAADVFSLVIGDCFNDGSSGQITDVPAVPCAEPHDNEVYFLFDMPDGEFPGDPAIEAAADTSCTGAFDTFVGLDYATSALDWFPITPTESSWGDGDREIICAVWDPAGKISGSLAGVAR